MKRLIALLLACAAPAAAQTIAITNGRVATMVPGAPDTQAATVLIRDGRIAAVGAALAIPPGARVIDAAGGWVTPGVFAGLSRLGIIESEGVDETNDSNTERDPGFSAALDIAPGINPRSVNLPINRIEGVTRAAVRPAAGPGVFAGQGAILSLGDGPLALTPRAFQYIELGQTGARIAGGARGAAFTLFRAHLLEARDFAARAPGRTGPARDSKLSRLDLEALAPVARGTQPLLVHVERAQDILNVLALRAEFPALKLVLVGAGEGWLVAREIAAARVPVITEPLRDLPANFEQLAATQSNVGRLVAAGVTVALGLFDDDDNRQLRLLPTQAGNLVALAGLPGAGGLSHAQALATITRAPAEIHGLGGELGTLAPGKRADVVVWSGDPLELASAPTAVLIDGREQPLTSRQTKLRDRYLGLRRDGATLHYKPR